MTIVNDDPGEQTAHVTVKFNSSLDDRSEVQMANIRAGHSVTLDLLDQHPGIAKMGDNDFLGSAMITSSRPVSAVSLISFGQSKKAASAFEAIPRSAGDSELYVPMFKANARGDGDHPLNTEIAVTNVGGSTTRVSIEYNGGGLSCPPGTKAKRPEASEPTWTAIKKGRTHIFSQRPGDGERLLDDCEGSAWIRTDNHLARIVAVVQQTQEYEGTVELAAAYNAASKKRDVGERLAVPLWRNSYTGMTSVIHVMNVGLRHTTVSLRLYDRAQNELPIEENTVTINPHGTGSFNLSNIGYAPEQEFGSAVLTADEPIVAIVAEQPRGGVRVALDAAIYNAIPFAP